jgi:hypothetical protein
MPIFFCTLYKKIHPFKFFFLNLTAAVRESTHLSSLVLKVTLEEREERSYNRVIWPKVLFVRRISGICPIALPDKFLKKKVHLAV